MAFINSILSIFTQKRLAQIDFFKANPIKVQRDTLQELLTLAANTEWSEISLQHYFDCRTIPGAFTDRPL